MTLSADQAPPGSVSAIADGRIPLDLRIGVTGHRNLADTPRLREAIELARELIVDQLRPAIRDRCSLVVVSALADGADRIVADRVLARHRARLEVILPMPRADYVTDFDSKDSFLEFEQLLDQASWVATIRPSRTRQDAYLEAGHAVIDRADITIAVWDGRPAAGKGGTGDLVWYLREQRRPWIWVSPDGSQVVAENLEKLADTGWLDMKDPDLDRFCRFNETPLAGEQLQESIDDFRQSILKASEADLAVNLTALLGWLEGPLARAELLSKRFQTRYLRISIMLFALSAAAVCIVGSQLVFLPDNRLIVLAEIACLILILAGLELGRSTHVQQRWISARYLAERLRSAFFLALVDADEQSATVADSGDIPVAPWVGIAFDMVWMRRPHLDAGPTSVVCLRSFLSRAWVSDQFLYFKNASQRAHRRYLFSTRAVEALFVLSAAVAIVHVALGGPEHWVMRIVAWLAISIPACAAALAGYSAQREYLRSSLRYGRIADSLDGANRRVLAATDRGKVREIAATVDLMLRQERGEWFGTAALHDLELPA